MQTEMSDMLQSMGLKRVGWDLATEQQYTWDNKAKQNLSSPKR